MAPNPQVHTEKVMAEKGIVLPSYQDAVWSYVKAQRDGNKLYIGDHVGQALNEETGQMETVRGKVGEEPDADVTPERAEEVRHFYESMRWMRVDC